MTRKTQRCAHCRAEKGKSHKSFCRYRDTDPSSAIYTDTTVYGTDTSSSSSSCDTSSSGSDGGSCG
jgi:hypothetical protein